MYQLLLITFLSLCGKHTVSTQFKGRKRKCAKFKWLPKGCGSVGNWDLSAAWPDHRAYSWLLHHILLDCMFPPIWIHNLSKICTWETSVGWEGCGWERKCSGPMYTGQCCLPTIKAVAVLFLPLLMFTFTIFIEDKTRRQWGFTLILVFWKSVES